MNDNTFVIQGNLFTRDFLAEAVTSTPEWLSLSDDAVSNFFSIISGIFRLFPTSPTTNEAQTEDDLIWPILYQLGWSDYLRQQNLAARGRDDVPDGLLFLDEAKKIQANSHTEQWRRYAHGAAIVESKRWLRPLDRRSSGRRGVEETSAPSTQMLRYLRRAEDLASGELRWGILTNGAKWRLYYQGAKSVSEDFFEIDLAAVMGVGDPGLFSLNPNEQTYWLRVFMLVFRRIGFQVTGPSSTTFHQRALEQGHFYEERVASSLSGLVYEKVFPEMLRAVASAAPSAPLEEVRNAALILLYRLLFILYAEDRSLLPTNERRYVGYSLRTRVREDVGRRKSHNDTFSDTASRYWAVIDDLTRAIDKGDTSIGLPPYNGGLFDDVRTPLLTRIRIADATMADIIDALSFQRVNNERRYINYRDLSVQQLGSIYERLLERELVKEDDVAVLRPNIFARKASGSYYTPDDLVRLTIKQTLEPLISARMNAFRQRAEELSADTRPTERRLALLGQLDPAMQLLELKICDPAMGSGHFLVSLVDFLADQVISAMAEAEVMVDWDDYVSPLSERIATIRNTILANADLNNWTVDVDQLDDRHIIRRMVLKRCVFGVDKNPMAVELAKVSLWLHTFTVGAPLSFLDHHLRAGDSLFGAWVSDTMAAVVRRRGKPLLLHKSITEATGSAAAMRIIEGLTDAEIAEAKNSSDVFNGIKLKTESLDRFMAILHALDWLDLKDSHDKEAVQAWLDGVFGDAIDVVLGKSTVPTTRSEGKRFSSILESAQALVDEQLFMNWQVAFPGVWKDWENEELSGGFDAIIGNPPWDRMKLQEVEWFAARRQDIAMLQRAADRKIAVAELNERNDPLARDYTKASSRAEAAIRVARKGGDYPLLSGGDLNIYSLFVEKAALLIKSTGMVGLVTPIGIGTDKTSAKFFSELASRHRLKAFLAFENRKGWLFKDVHHEDQPTVIIFGKTDGSFPEFSFGVKLRQIPDDAYLQSHKLTGEACKRINPNTGTVPIFRSSRDAEITSSIYAKLPILADRSSSETVKAWPVTYATMFHMTNQSKLFRRRDELEGVEGAYPIGGQIWDSGTGRWHPLFEGKMISNYNHRYAGVRSNSKNISGQGVGEHSSEEQLASPTFVPEPRFWVAEAHLKMRTKFAIAFNDVCNTNNARSIIASFVPFAAFGNTLPLLLPDDASVAAKMPVLLANLNSIVCDYVARQKIQSRHLNKYIIEQIPVVSASAADSTLLGTKTASAIINEAVLELTYTSENMASFAQDMGYVDNFGGVLRPFAWDNSRRIMLRAKLDAVFFCLYGITDREDVEYIYSTFPIVEKNELIEHNRYISRDMCLAWINALKAGKPDADIRLQ